MASKSDGLQGQQAAGLAPVNTRLRALLIVVVLLVLGVFLAPRLQALYNQIQGGQIIDRVLRSGAGASLGPVACDFHLSGDSAEVGQINQAAAYLQTSARQNPRSSHTYLLLGRAYCLLGEPQQAVDAYRAYTELRPLNPLGHQELGFAIEALCQANSAPAGDQPASVVPFCQDADARASMAEEWRKAGIVIGQFNAEANLAFNGERYADAARWYERGALFDPEPSPENIFRWTVASIASRNALPDMPFAVPDLAIHPLTDTFSINGADLAWILSNKANDLNYGDPLSKFPTGARSTGVLWWAGRAAFFVNVREQAAYRLRMRVMGRLPEGQKGPLELQVERDFFPVEKYSLSGAPQEWQELEAATVLTPGLHIISIRFLKDDGDILVNWVRLEKAVEGP